MRDQRRAGDRARQHVVVACGAANSAKLLLMSANEKHPNGLANGSDQVGRNYMFHTSQAVLAISLEPNNTQYQKTLGINDFYFGMKDFDFPVGSIQMVGKSQAPMFRGEKPIETLLAPTWSLEQLAAHAVDFWLMTEDLPSPDNRITVDKNGQITLSYTGTNQEPSNRLYAQLQAMLGSLGCQHVAIPRHIYLKNDVGVAGRGAPIGHVPVRQRPEDLRARRELQGARARQPLRRRHPASCRASAR